MSKNKNLKGIKKFIVLVLAIVMLAPMVAPTTVEAASGYGFKSKGVTVKPGGNASSFIDANKSYYKSIKSAKSCIANKGYDVTRRYTYFTLVTYASDKNGKGKVEQIAITSKSVSTPEGLKCGNTVSKLKKCYKNAKKLGSNYYVTKGKTKITFKIKSDKVTQITYLYTGKF